MNKLQRRQLGINKARRILRIWRMRWFDIHKDYLADGGQCEHLLLQTRSPFSRNRRQYYGLTIQERKANLEYTPPLASSYLGADKDGSI